jgi:hypothetical protein
MNNLEFVGAMTIAIVVLYGLVIAGLGISKLLKGKQTAPALVGTRVPETELGIDLSKRYDIVYVFSEYGSSSVPQHIRAARILGYVGQPGDHADDSSKFYMPSRWLAVELPDGRKAFLMPRGITLLQESSDPVDPKELRV